MQVLALTDPAGKDTRIKVAAERIGDHAIGNTVFCVALLHKRIHEELSIIVGEEFIDLRLSSAVFRSSLVIGHGNPLCDGQVRQSGAHRRITGDDAIEDRRIALGEDHAFAPACGTADEVGVRSRFCVVTRDDLFGDSGYFSVGEKGEVEIGLLIAHEREVECAGLCFVSCIGACYGKPARKSGSIAGIVRAGGIGHDAVATSAALHHKVAVPRGLVG